MDAPLALPVHLSHMVRQALIENAWFLHFEWNSEHRRKWYAYCGHCDQGGWFLLKETALAKIGRHAEVHTAQKTPSASRVPTMG